MWLDSHADLLAGDVIVPRFGADLAPIVRTEAAGSGVRIYHTDGSTSRVRDGERIYVRRPTI